MVTYVIIFFVLILVFPYAQTFSISKVEDKGMKKIGIGILCIVLFLAGILFFYRQYARRAILDGPGMVYHWDDYLEGEWKAQDYEVVIDAQSITIQKNGEVLYQGGYRKDEEKGYIVGEEEFPEFSYFSTLYYDLYGVKKDGSKVEFERK